MHLWVGQAGLAVQRLELRNELPTLNKVRKNRADHNKRLVEALGITEVEGGE